MQHDRPDAIRAFTGVFPGSDYGAFAGRRSGNDGVGSALGEFDRAVGVGCECKDAAGAARRPNQIDAVGAGRGPALSAFAERRFRLSRHAAEKLLVATPDRNNLAVAIDGESAAIHRTGIERPCAEAELDWAIERAAVVLRVDEIYVAIAGNIVSPHHVQPAPRVERHLRLAALTDRAVGRFVDQAFVPRRAAIVGCRAQTCVFCSRRSSHTQ